MAKREDEAASSDDLPKDALLAFWTEELQVAWRYERNWRIDAEHAVELYRDQDSLEGGHGGGRGGGRGSGSENALNVLWSTTQVLTASTFSRMPLPSLSRAQIGMTDEAGQVAMRSAETLERIMHYLVDPGAEDDSAYRAFKADNWDSLVAGRGVSRVRYEAETTKERRPILPGEPFPEDGVMIDEEFVETEQVDPRTERIWVEHIYWRDFRMSPARDWGDVWWVAFAHDMTRPELDETFTAGAKVEVSQPQTSDDGQRHYSDASTEQGDERLASTVPTARVWEIEDRRAGRVLWMAEKHDQMLVLKGNPEGEPAIDVDGFFDCAMPVQVAGTTGTMEPITLYSRYQKLAEELNTVHSRMQRVTASIKTGGVYDGMLQGMVDISGAADGRYAPVTNAAALAEKGGLAAAIFNWPLGEAAAVLDKLSQRKNELKIDIAETIGMIDIKKGSTDPRETLGAQNLKFRASETLLSPLREPIQHHVEATYRIMAEVAAERMTRESMSRMAGEQVQDDVFQYLRSERLRPFVIEVSTDEMVAPNKVLEREDAGAFIQMVTSYLAMVGDLGEKLGPASSAVLSRLLMELLKFGVSSAGIGRSLESLIDETAEAWQQVLMQQAEAAQQPPPPPQPSPDTQLLAEMELKKTEEQEETDRAKIASDAESDERDRQLKLLIARINVAAKGRQSVLAALTQERRGQRISSRNGA